MQALDGPVREAGVTVLNEIGVDPGIDHMSAMRIIDAVHKKGGTIESFKSYCGGLPGSYNPVLDELEEMDIVCEDHTEAF